jgi:hypothetical protein
MRAQLDPEIERRQQHRYREHTDDCRCVGSEPHQAPRDAADEVGSEARDARAEDRHRIAQRTRQRAPSSVHVAHDTIHCFVCILHDFKLGAPAQICRAALSQKGCRTTAEAPFCARGARSLLNSMSGAISVLWLLIPHPTRLNGFDFGTGSTEIAPNDTELVSRTTEHRAGDLYLSPWRQSSGWLITQCRRFTDCVGECPARGSANVANVDVDRAFRLDDVLWERLIKATPANR